jgi:hypothetical protein
MKKLPIFVSCLAMLILPQAILAQSHAFLIVPGKSIGRTHLGPHGSRYLKRLPRPAADDAGMMQNHSVWTSHAPGRTLQTLSIHTVANGALNVPPIDGVTIDEIRITSPAFHTRSGLHTGNSMVSIHQQFPLPTGHRLRVHRNPLHCHHSLSSRPPSHR